MYNINENFSKISRKYLKESQPNGNRWIYEIAADIKKVWGAQKGGINYAAKPYLDAMMNLSKITDNYYQDSAKSVILYFLSNASQFKGEEAKELKKELKCLLDNKKYLKEFYRDVGGENRITDEDTPEYEKAIRRGERSANLDLDLDVSADENDDDFLNLTHDDADDETDDGPIAYTVPEHLAAAIINGDMTGLTDDEEEELNAFLQGVADDHGHANFTTGDDDYEEFSIRNDVNNMAGPTVKLYLDTNNYNVHEGFSQISRKYLTESSGMNYTAGHNTYTSAIQEAERWVKSQGFDIDNEEWARDIGLGPSKPKSGNFNRFDLSLFKNDKLQKKYLHVRVYHTGYNPNEYELSMHIS